VKVHCIEGCEVKDSLGRKSCFGLCQRQLPAVLKHYYGTSENQNSWLVTKADCDPCTSAVVENLCGINGYRSSPDSCGSSASIGSSCNGNSEKGEPSPGVCDATCDCVCPDGEFAGQKPVGQPCKVKTGPDTGKTGIVGKDCVCKVQKPNRCQCSGAETASPKAVGGIPPTCYSAADCPGGVAGYPLCLALCEKEYPGVYTVGKCVKEVNACPTS
jgi:hypothetical protein